MKRYYPAIFIPYENGFTVEFPDLPGCVTQGNSLEEAFEMAEDAACGWILTSIEDKEEIPSPSPISAVNSAEGFVNYIFLDIEKYAKQYSTKSVKKTLTIPEWLNCLADRQGINYSQELQEALKVRLGLSLPKTTEIDELVTVLQENTKKLEHLITVHPSPAFSTNSASISVTSLSSFQSNSFRAQSPLSVFPN